MKRPIVTLFLAATLVSTVNAHGAEVDSFSVNAGLTYGYGIDDNVSMQGELELEPAIDIKFTQRSSLHVSARFRLDQQDELEPGRNAYDSYSAASRPVSLGTAGSAELRDFYVEIRSANGRTRFGKQQLVWGRLDGLKVLDVLNPQDFREFIYDDFADSRIGLWSAYFDYSFGKWRTELAVIPDGTGHAIPEPGAWYELTAPRFRFGSGVTASSLPTSSERPGIRLDDTGVGLRLSRQLWGADVSAVAHSGNDPEPLGRIAVTGAQDRIVERFYERRETLGLSVDIGLGATVLRAEHAYHPSRIFNTRSNGQLTTTALDQRRSAIGLDVDGPFGIFINLQHLIDTVVNAPVNLVRPSTDRVGTLYLRRTFAYDRLSIEARWYRSFTDDDQQSAVHIAYAVNDSTTIEIGAQYSSGDSGGLFGQFAANDRIRIGLMHTF